MLKVYIGPNGYGKSYAIDEEIKELKKENEARKDIIKLGAELVFAEEMKDSVNSSFVLDYLVEELLETDEIIAAREEYEKRINDSIITNKQNYNDIMDEVLKLNNKIRKQDVIDVSTKIEHKKLVSINSSDLKKSMGSGQKLQFLLKLIEASSKKYVFLDEPENHTHPSLLHVTAGLINKLSKTKEVCVATHSPELLSLLDVDFNNLYIFNSEDYSGPKKIDFSTATSIPTGFHLENLNKKSQSYYSEETLKRNILEIHKKEFMASLFSKRVYLVEGLNDAIFLKKLLFHFSKQYSQYEIFHGYGKLHYLPFVNIFKSLGIEVIPIFDEDPKKADPKNNIVLNTELESCGKFCKFSPFIEEAIGYTGKKDCTTDFIDFLDEFNDYDSYKNIVD